MQEKKYMNYNDFEKYISAETMMGPNSVRVLEELLCKYPLQFKTDDIILDLGCGTGLKNAYTGRAEELLSDWLGDEAYMFKSAKKWKEIIGSHDRIEEVETWEMSCFDKAWDEWLACDNEFAKGDKLYFDSIIKPYTTFVGIYIKVK